MIPKISFTREWQVKSHPLQAQPSPIVVPAPSPNHMRCNKGSIFVLRIIRHGTGFDVNIHHCMYVRSIYTYVHALTSILWSSRSTLLNVRGPWHKYPSRFIKTGQARQVHSWVLLLYAVITSFLSVTDKQPTKLFTFSFRCWTRKVEKTYIWTWKTSLPN